ncbi:hypothetical protein CH286_25810 [Rhodococcus sp. WWJCD1]|nr:hypothetical protein CH286_25810 [Rhodococcus sp. WWJCD1]OZE89359.1 hypothetical protein CH302_28755 [Rhodococcus sp. 15-2388-1-1a]
MPFVAGHRPVHGPPSAHKMRAGPRDGDWLLPRRSTPTYAGASALAAIMITAPIALAVFDVTRNMWCLRAGGVTARFGGATSGAP